jgi:hypothetical protein
MMSAAVLSILVAGCATTTESSQAHIDVAPNVTLRLPIRQPFGDGANAVQLVQATYKDRTETFQAIITSKGDSLTFVMTLPNGPRIMSFEWRGAKLTSKSESIAPRGITAEHMLADIIAIYAPAEIVNSSLDGGKLSVQPDGTREIRSAGNLVIRVRFPGGDPKTPWKGQAVLQNLAFEYRLDINSQPLNQ